MLVDPFQVEKTAMASSKNVNSKTVLVITVAVLLTSTTPHLPYPVHPLLRTRQNPRAEPYVSTIMHVYFHLRVRS